MYLGTMLSFVLVLLFQLAIGGTPGFHCPRRDGGFVLVPCAEHCSTAHCAPDGGVCDDSYNCICGRFSTCEPPTIQCSAPSPIEELACEFDCQCNHGTVGGACDYEAKGCKCDAPSLTACPTFLRSPQAIHEMLSILGGKQ